MLDQNKILKSAKPHLGRTRPEPIRSRTWADHPVSWCWWNQRVRIILGETNHKMFYLFSIHAYETVAIYMYICHRNRRNIKEVKSWWNQLYKTQIHITAKFDCNNRMITWHKIEMIVTTKLLQKSHERPRQITTRKRDSFVLNKKWYYTLYIYKCIHIYVYIFMTNFDVSQCPC